MENTKVIGITGGFSSGKSSAAKHIAGLGHKVIFTDDLAKELMISSEQIKLKIKDEFGDAAYDEKGELNREYLAELVFSTNPEASKNLEKLDAIVHPVVIDKMIELTEQYMEEGEKYVFIESALIFELDLEEGFDYVICVNSSEENCINRAVQYRNISREQAELRLKNQMSMQEKCGLADFVIENNKGLDELHKAVDLILAFI